jgi:hypothetical protein
VARKIFPFDPKAAQSRLRAETKRQARELVKAEEAVIWNGLVAEQLATARSRPVEPWAPKQRPNKSTPLEDGERALQQAIELFNQYVDAEEERVKRYCRDIFEEITRCENAHGKDVWDKPDVVRTLDAQARLFTGGRMRGFMHRPDVGNPRLVALVRRARRLRGDDVLDGVLDAAKARLRRIVRTFLRTAPQRLRVAVLQQLRIARAEITKFRREHGPLKARYFDDWGATATVHLPTRHRRMGVVSYRTFATDALWEDDFSDAFERSDEDKSA